MNLSFFYILQKSAILLDNNTFYLHVIFKLMLIVLLQSLKLFEERHAEHI